MTINQYQDFFQDSNHHHRTYSLVLDTAPATPGSPWPRRRLEAECLSAEDLVQKLQLKQLQPGARRGLGGIAFRAGWEAARWL